MKIKYKQHYNPENNMIRIIDYCHSDQYKVDLLDGLKNEKVPSLIKERIKVELKII